MDDENIGPDNLTPDNLEETREPVPDPKTSAMQDAVLWLLWLLFAWVLPITAWIVICGGTALYASDHTSKMMAIIVGLVVGTVVIGFFVHLGFEEIELGYCSLGVLVLAFTFLLPFVQNRQKAIQKQRNHTQQERKQSRSRREVVPIFLMARHYSEVL